MATFILFPKSKIWKTVIPPWNSLNSRFANYGFVLYWPTVLAWEGSVWPVFPYSSCNASVLLRDKWQTIWKIISLRKHWHFFWLQCLLVSCNKWSCIQSCCLPRRSIGSKLFQIFSFLFIFSVKLASCVMSTVIAFTKTLILVFCFFSPGF